LRLQHLSSKQRLQVRFFQLFYRAGQRYWNGTHYSRNHFLSIERELKSLSAIYKSARSSHPAKQWLMLIRGILAQRHRKYTLAVEYLRGLRWSKRTADTAARGWIFLAQEVVYHHRPKGWSTQPFLRQIHAYRKVWRKTPNKLWKAYAAYHMGSRLYSLTAHRTKGLKLWARCARMKPVNRWQRSCLSMVNSYIAPRLSIITPHLVRPGTKWTLQVGLGRVKKGRLTLYRIDPRPAFLQKRALFDLNKVRLLRKLWSKRIFLPQGIKPDWQQGTPWPVQLKYRLPRPGSYMLELTASNQFKAVRTVRVPLFVSHAGILVKQRGKRVWVMMADGRNNRPYKGVDFILGSSRRSYMRYRPTYSYSSYGYSYPYRSYRRYGRYPRYGRYYRRRYGIGNRRLVNNRRWYAYNLQIEQRKIVPSRTSGIWEGRMSKPVGNYKQLLVLACRGNECVLNRSMGAYLYGRQEKGVLYWVCDRGAYKPGQKAHCKGVFQRRKGAQWQSIQGYKVRIQVLSARNKTITTKLLPLSGLGTFGASWSWPKDMALGKVSLRFQLIPPRRRLRRYSFYRTLRVEEYRRPRFEVSVTPLQKGKQILGSRIRWKIKARTLTGQPVAGGKVRWRLTWARTSRPYYQAFSSRWDWFYRQARKPYHVYRTNQSNALYYVRYYTSLIRRKERFYKRYPRYRYRRKRILHYYRQQLARYQAMLSKVSGVGTLNKHGELVIETPTDAKRLNYYYKYRLYRLVVDVSDATQRTLKGTGELLLGRVNSRLYLKLERTLVGPGDDIVAKVRLLRPSGQGLQRSGELTFSKVLKIGKQGLEVKRKLRFKTDRQGFARIRFSADYLGYFQIKVRVPNDNGGWHQASSYLWLGSPKMGRSRYLSRQVHFQVDRTTVAPGEKLRFLLQTKQPPSSFVLAVEGGSLLETRLLASGGSSHYFELPVKASYAPNVWISVFYLQGYRLIRRTVMIRVLPAKRFLKVKLTAVKSRYRPGAQVEWKVKAVDFQGRPVKAELMLVAYDKALEQIGKTSFPDIRRHFHKHTRFFGWRYATLPSWLPSYYWQLPPGNANYLRRRSRFPRRRAKLKNPWPRRSRYKRKYAKSYRRRKRRSRTHSRPRLLKSRPSITGRSGGRAYLGSRSAPSRRSIVPRPRSIPRPSSPRPARRYATKKLLDASTTRRRGGAVLLSTGRVSARWARPRVRRSFEETAVWLSSVQTNAVGVGRVRFRWPDSLTSWTIRAIAVAPGVRVGSLQTQTETSQPLMVQMSAPRFLMERDRFRVGVMVYNRHQKRTIRVRFKAKGARMTSSSSQNLTLEAGESRKVWFALKAGSSGEMTLRAVVRSRGAADAVELKRPILPFGMEKREHLALTLEKGRYKKWEFVLPQKLLASSVRLELSVSSSLTRSVFDSLGYLVNFPYGCVEQTMSRFLPASLVGKTLAGLNKVEPSLVRKLPRVLKAGLGRLLRFQHNDGGWGWWKRDRTNDFMTAYVLFGLATARDAGISVPSTATRRGVSYLQRRLSALRSKPALHAYALYALSLYKKAPAAEVDASFASLKRLNPYGLSLLSLVYAKRGDKRSARYVLKLLHKQLRTDGTQQAYVVGGGTLRGGFRNGIEATAMTLRAYMASNQHRQLWPRMVRWLLNQRRGRRWNSTRDTAQVLLSLAVFARKSRESASNRQLKLWYKGRFYKTIRMWAEDPSKAGFNLTFPTKFARGGQRLRLEMKNTGQGPLYLSLRLRYRVRVQRIHAGGTGQLRVERKFFRVVREKGSERLEELSTGGSVPAGAIVEVQLRLSAKRALKYVHLSEPRAAGLETVETRSGRYRGAPWWLSFREFRKKKVSFFAQRLRKSGRYLLKLRLRAERPGRYRVMPAMAQPMYVPGIFAFSDSFELVITP
jgi:hypothetical protein